METLELTIEKIKNTVVAFHIGRGGRWYNQGHKTYLGEHRIGDYTNDLFLFFENSKDIFKHLKTEIEEFNENEWFNLLSDCENLQCDTKQIEEKYNLESGELGELVYFHENGNPVGLTYKEEETGIGCINIDYDYDTTYTHSLYDCDENELQLIRDSREFNYMDDDIQDYIKNELGEEKE